MSTTAEERYYLARDVQFVLDGKWEFGEAWYGWDVIKRLLAERDALAAEVDALKAASRDRPVVDRALYERGYKDGLAAAKNPG